MKARLCTREEIAASCAERTGCDYDYSFIWTSSPCRPSEGFGAGRFGHFVGPGDMKKWVNRYAKQPAPGFPWADGAIIVPSTHNVEWPESGLKELGFIKPWGYNYRYTDAMKALLGEDINICNPLDKENGQCCFPDSYQKTKFFVRCCADYGTTPACERCPPGKTSLPGYSKGLDSCFCTGGSLDEDGGCTGPDEGNPDLNGIVTRTPTSAETPSPTFPPTLPECPQVQMEEYCRKFNSENACRKSPKGDSFLREQRLLDIEERPGELPVVQK